MTKHWIFSLLLSSVMSTQCPRIVWAQTAPVATELAEPPAAVHDDPEVQGQVRRAQQACREMQRADVFGYVALPTLAVTGIALSIVGFTTPTPQRTSTTFFLNAFGPGLVLGAIGVPLTRGWIGSVDPLPAACRTLLQAGAPSAEQRILVDALLRANGAPGSPALAILLGAATALVTGGVVLALVLDNRDLAQAMGGIGAAVVAGWSIVPVIPQAAAARQYRANSPEIRLSLAVDPHRQSYGLGLVGAF
ncbi:MAG: hypothetical protein Q8Q09_04780 [Deltaproteobacteria bacterium]|nr:hypothetical protein [Deltaproteobacteria bacterium]